MTKQLLEALNGGDVREIVSQFFEAEEGIPKVRAGFRRERDLWDYKAGLPGRQPQHDNAWARIASHVAGFSNADGGVLFFGIEEPEYRFVGTRDRVDSKMFNDKIRRYVGDSVWVDFSREFIQSDQRYLGVAVVPKRSALPIRMQSAAPPEPNGSRLFQAGDLCVRVKDSTRIFSGAEATEFLTRNRLPIPDAVFALREPNARILRPDWENFILREALCAAVKKGLLDDRTYAVTLAGIGGIGKTALATWGVLEAYRENLFDYYVSVSAKDRSLTERGITAERPTLTSFDDLLDQLADVLGFSELRSLQSQQKEQEVRDLLKDTRTLIYVDNLETVVDDSRLINFLENLPKPVKTITTSRIAAIKVAAYPITVGPLTDAEAIRLFDESAKRKDRGSLLFASAAEKQRIVSACTHVPLAIEWLVGQSKDVPAAVALADAFSQSGKRGEELLEFCFRRVHSNLPEPEKLILAALSLDDRSMELLALSAATDLEVESVESALVTLMDHSLVERQWDARTNDYKYKVVTLTRRFGYREVHKTVGAETRMRQRLSAWYEARDVPEAHREHIRASRLGNRDPEVELVDMAIARRRDGFRTDAAELFMRALTRNPTSWRAHREYAEFLRDEQRIGEALEQYELAAKYAPNRGNDRALIFRELGMLLRQTGREDAHRIAIEKFEDARKETPNDPVLLHALANSYRKLLQYRLAQPILEALIDGGNADTRARSYPLLEEVYAKLNERILLGKLRDRMHADGAARLGRTPRIREVERTSRPLVPRDPKRRN